MVPPIGLSNLPVDVNLPKAGPRAPHGGKGSPDEAPMVQFQRENQRIVQEAVSRRASQGHGPSGPAGPGGHERATPSARALKTVETRVRTRSPLGGANSHVAAPAGKAADSALDAVYARMREAFNPEATAERLFQFSMTGYGKKQFAGPDTAEHRESFRATAMTWFDEGFADARKILASLPDPIPAAVNETHERLVAKFDAWVGAAPTGSSSSLN